MTGARGGAVPRWSRWVGLGARLVLGGTFVAAGLLKAGDPQAAVRAVTAYQLLPYGVAQVVGWALPWLEIGLGVLLVVGLLTRWAALVTGLLLVGFLVGVSSAWARGLSIDCGCFGGGGEVAPDRTAYVQEILRDLGLLLLAGWLVRRPASALSIDPQPAPSYDATAPAEPEVTP